MWHNYLPAEFKRNCWIACMHNEDPIAAEGTIEVISRGKRCKRKSCNRTILEEYRGIFNNIRPIINSTNDPVRPVINSASSFLAITSPVEPKKCTTFHCMLTSLYVDLQKRSSFEYFDKNANLGALSMPFSVADLLEGAQLHFFRAGVFNNRTQRRSRMNRTVNDRSGNKECIRKRYNNN